MSASLKLKVGAAIAAMTCSLLGSAFAAEIDPVTGKPIAPPARDNATDRAGQLDSSQGPPPLQRTLRGQRYTTNYGNAQAAPAFNSQANQEVDNYLANCLLKNNKAEIELAKYAEQQTQNPDVKKFASQLVEDHQQLVQKLEQVASAHPATGAIGSPSLDKNAATGTDRTTLGATGGVPATPGSLSTNTTTPPGTTSNPATDLDRNTATALAVNNADHHASGALAQLAGIEDRINERCNQALREELQQKSGADFDQCFVGSQIAGHMHMLAALEVISQDSQGPLKQVAEEARPIVQKHLDHAKQWALEAKSAESRPAQAQRTTTSAEAQR